MTTRHWIDAATAARLREAEARGDDLDIALVSVVIDLLVDERGPKGAADVLADAEQFLRRMLT